MESTGHFNIKVELWAWLMGEVRCGGAKGRAGGRLFGGLWAVLKQTGKQGVRQCSE